MAVCEPPLPPGVCHLIIETCVRHRVQGYPVPNENRAMFEACARASNLDPEKIRHDAEV
jgi:hypothetical protein